MPTNVIDTTSVQYSTPFSTPYAHFHVSTVNYSVTDSESCESLSIASNDPIHQSILGLHINQSMPSVVKLVAGARIRTCVKSGYESDAGTVTRIHSSPSRNNQRT